MKAINRLCLTVAASVALLPQVGSAQEFDRPMPPAFLQAMEPMVERSAATDTVVTTRHTARINGRDISYDAIVSETPVQNAAGEDAAVIVTYGYVARGLGDAAQRPVLFVFNGGPGASSSPLHMKAFGPRRLVDAEGETRLVDNQYSLLDVADLVFIDPPGTGASMPIAGADPASLFSVAGDARAVAQVVQAWRVANGRTGSPFALVGESYGTARALAMLDQQMEAELPLPDGVALLSLAIGDTSGPVVADAVLLPTLAAVAWYHDAVDRRGMSAQQWFDAALTFAQTDYAAALMKGPTLSAEARADVARRLSALIGIPQADLLAWDLHLPKPDFMLGLLEDRGLRTGQLDARVTRAIADSDFQPPFDDPSMTLGTQTTSAIESYLADDLGYVVPSAYRSLNLGVNFRWGWGDGQSYSSARFTPYLQAALERKPAMALYTAGGIYDITTPAYAGLFALDYAGIPRDRRTTKLYAAGHSVFEDEAGLAAMSADLREWAARLSD